MIWHADRDLRVGVPTGSRTQRGVWRPLPSAVEMQGQLAPLVGMQPWELRTKGE